MSRLRRAALLLLLSSLPACASLEGIWNPPGRLLAQARAALEAKDFEAAYGDLAQLRRRYPASPECREAFPTAAALVQRHYFRDRFRAPTSPWVTTEPRFMLDWLASYLDGAESPEPEAKALFLGMPYGYFREYLALVEGRPHRFRIHAVDDNGVIEEVTAELATP